jgi:hypothetical protein
MTSRALTALCGLLFVVAVAQGGESPGPDPASVRRYGPAYRYPQAGWTVLHVEGGPFDRGYQHGRLMASEIEEYINTLARQQSAKAPADGWRLTRALVGAAFLRKFDREYLEEMTGIADGASAAGAKFNDRPIDLLDIATVNLVCEYETLDPALEAQPTGLEGVRFPKPAAPKPAPAKEKDHCSAFAATGPATADGKMVIGHITMSGLPNAIFSNVWLDVKPAKGHRVVMQSYPGGIQSMMDYYINSAGLVVTETTISQTRFNPEGAPLASRIRKALQYGSTIDDIVKVLTEKNNGLYTNEWLIGDANTNEIAILELGTTTHKLRRSSKNEWLLPGVDGFYWGCNNTKDLQVRIDTFASLADRPQDVSWKPSIRDKAWLREYEANRGKIDADFGKKAFATPPLSARPSLDAKVTTADQAKRLESYAVFGPPYAAVWEPTAKDESTIPGIQALVPNDWCVLRATGPAKADSVKVADISERVMAKEADPQPEMPTTPAWHGTLLPRADADLWITAGFAQYERIVALENALRQQAEDNKLTAADQKKVDLALFRYRADYHAARAARPDWRKGGTAPTAIAAELDRDRWHREQVASGVLTLHALRGLAGAERFAQAMEAFGKANAGKEVSTQEFAAAVGKVTGIDVVTFLEKNRTAPAAGDLVASTTDWLADLDNSIIVYGTRTEVAANEAAAKRLQKAARVKWTNITVPVKADRDVTDGDLKGRHIILVGRPATNSLTDRFRSTFPVTFGTGSVTIAKEAYAHEKTTILTAGVNPIDPRYTAVAIAGLSGSATYSVAEAVVDLSESSDLVVAPAGGRLEPRVTPKETAPGTPAAAGASR